MATERTNLKLLRVKHKLTQEEFAKRIGYSRSQYALIEQGKRNGTIGFWKNVKKAFNVSDGELWELTRIDGEK